MSSTLQAKISVPRLPQVVIPQRGLSQCFERAQASEIVLVCAPAGYGKTTFVSSYCASSTRVNCWYSLDEPDNDPGVFGQYLVGSLAKCFSLSVELRYKAVHGGYQHILDLVRELLIELETQPTAACLVLDDCHHISHPSILSALQFFLIYLPVTIQAVLISRSEPAALSRLYSQRHVVRFASADLGLDETAVMALFSAHGQQLSADGAQQLHRKTQGWVTGLKLIALNHSLTTDLAAIADTLPRREIQNYLFHEIYVKQDADLQRFLKQTAISERFNPELAQHLTGLSHIEPLLQQLEQQQFFFSPLGEEQLWFRYHPLLAEFLRALLKPDELGLLHVQAAEWWQQTGQLAIAAQHYAASRDVAAISRFVLQEGMFLFNLGHTHALSGCLNSLPRAAIAASSPLTTLCAWFEHVVQRQPDKVEPLLAAAQQRLFAELASDQAEVESLAYFGSVQTSVWLEAGNLPPALALSQRIYQQYLRQPETLVPAPLFSALSDIGVQQGELAQALHYSLQAADYDRQHRMFLGVFWHLHQQAALAYYSGDFHGMDKLLTNAMLLIKEHKLGFIPRYDTWLRSKARLAWQRLQFQDARHFVEMALSHNEAWPHEQILNQVQLGHVLLAQQDWAKLQSLSSQLEAAWFNQKHWPRVQVELEYLLVQLWSLRQDQSMLQRYCLSTTPPELVTNPEGQTRLHTLAWAYLALNQPQQALSTLAPALVQAQQKQLLTAYQLGLMLQVAANWQLGQTEVALAQLASSLAWIQSQQAYMSVLCLGPWLDAPLEQLSATQSAAQTVAQRLLQLLRQRQSPLNRSQRQELPDVVRSFGLTRQEWQILQLMATQRSNDELCDSLHLSMNTIRSHIRRLNKKIGAKTRQEAVQVALALQTNELASLPSYMNEISPLLSPPQT